MKLTFLGAAGEVTGSSYLLETDDVKVLVDCGMFQGGREAEPKNRARFAFDPKTLDCVLLTHAHIDHSGLLPRLIAAGYTGPVYATPATCDLLEVMLADSAHIQESDVEWLNRHRKRDNLPPVEPTYTLIDANRHQLDLVGRKLASKGGRAVISIANSVPATAYVAAEAVLIGKVRLGLPARVYTDAFPDEPLSATVRYIAAQAQFTPKEVQTPDERVKLVYAVKLYLDANPQHRATPGLPADAVIRWKEGAPWARPRW